MKILSLTTLTLTTLFFSSNLLAELPSRFSTDFNNDWMDGFTYNFPSGFGNNGSYNSSSGSECKPDDSGDHDHPPELHLSTTPFTYDSPILAVNAFDPIQRIASEYLKMGFELSDHYAEIYNYLIAPTGDYHWGDYIIELRGPSPPNSLTTSYITITVFISYIEEDDGYRASGFDVRQENIY